MTERTKPLNQMTYVEIIRVTNLSLAPRDPKDMSYCQFLKWLSEGKPNMSQQPDSSETTSTKEILQKEPRPPSSP